MTTGLRQDIEPKDLKIEIKSLILQAERWIDMRFKIHHEKSEDSIVVEGETIENIQVKARKEMNKRGWKEEDCWSVDASGNA